MDRPSPPGLVKVFKVVDVLNVEFVRRGAHPSDPSSKMTRVSADSLHMHEVKQVIDLSTAFSGDAQQDSYILTLY